MQLSLAYVKVSIHTIYIALTLLFYSKVPMQGK